MADYHNTHWTKWTPAMHAAYNRDAAAQALRTAQANGFKTAAEYERAQSEIYSALNRACDTRVW